MSRRGNYGSMGDRLAATRDAQTHRAAPAGQDPQPTRDELTIEDAKAMIGGELADRPRANDVRHVWVTTEEGRMAGLLIEWHYGDAGWRGRCVYPHGHLVVEDWVLAAQLQPV